MNHIARTRVSAALLLGLALAFSAACAGTAADDGSSSEPWGRNTVAPADLVKELAGADKPAIVCTAPSSMYRRARIPGAVLYGPASEPGAITALTAWAKPRPRTSNIVIYCGCCPLAYCPNLRPAYKALADMGFTRVRVLILPDNFGTDWLEKGYPAER
jgi:thiosulfate/3-mercaptopyruvate sulfurtransferase